MTTYICITILCQASKGGFKSLIKCVQVEERSEIEPLRPAQQVDFELEPNPVNSKEEVGLVDDSCIAPEPVAEADESAEDSDERESDSAELRDFGKLLDDNEGVLAPENLPKNWQLDKTDEH